LHWVRTALRDQDLDDERSDAQRLNSGDLADADEQCEKGTAEIAGKVRVVEQFVADVEHEAARLAGPRIHRRLPPSGASAPVAYSGLVTINHPLSSLEDLALPIGAAWKQRVTNSDPNAVAEIPWPG
jgi:hypothetical protein